MWITALVLGLAGSVHCAAMCSPLAFAVTTLTPSALLNRIIYNAGRIFTYGLLGALFSGVGLLLPIGQYQNILSIAVGAMLVVVGVFGFGAIRIQGVTTVLNKGTIGFKELFGSLLKKRSRASVFALGALNGFLPCGLSFVALTYCILLRGPLDGFNFMILFGTGTLPAMLGVTSVLVYLTRRLQISMSHLSSVLMAGTGLLLIARVFMMASHEAREQGGSIIEVLCQ